MKIEHILPADIERRSMEIIEEELGEICLPPMEKDVIKRVIHTSADFEYARTLRFSDAAVERGLAALRQGCTIVTDTNMACTGISQAALDKLGCRKVCLWPTRRSCRSKGQGDDAGRCLHGQGLPSRGAGHHRRRQRADGPHPPSRAHGAGKDTAGARHRCSRSFVNVVYAKELIMAGRAPYIAAKGRKGGSNIAAAICNALLYKLTRDA